MRIAEMLQAIATWLESPDNEAILLAEYDDQCLKVVAESCVEAAALLKNAAEKVALVEPEEESLVTSENLESLAELAEALDSSDDVELKKQASLIDELLLTVAASPELLAEKRKEADRRIEELKKKYEESKKKLDEKNKVVEVKKAIDNSGMTDEFKINMQSLKSRYCPNHPGVSMLRLEDQVYQCPLDSKIFNYETGYDLENGIHVPGGSVQNQTEMLNDNMYTNFDTRESRTKN